MQINFSDYKNEILKLKPVLEKLKITDKTFPQIINLLSFNRFIEYTSTNVPNMQQEQEELAAFLNSLSSFKKFPVSVLHSPMKTLSVPGEYFLYKGTDTPTAEPKSLVPYFSFLRNSGEILFRDTDNTVIYPIIEALLFSNNEVIRSAMVNYYSSEFINLSFSSTKTTFKGLTPQEIEDKIHTNLNQLTSYFSQYFDFDNNYVFQRKLDILAKKEDHNYPYYSNELYLRMSMKDVQKHLPEFINYIPYLMLPRKIDAVTIPLAKKYIEKIAEFNDKSIALVQNDTPLNQKSTERLLEIIFNHLWIVNKHQEAALKEQSVEGTDFNDFIVEQLPKRAKNKNLAPKNNTFPVISSGFLNELTIEIECDLKDFTTKTGITKEMIKYYLRDVDNEQNRPYNRNNDSCQGENIFLLESTGTLKFGVNYSYSEQQTFADKKELTDFYALLVFEKLISVLEEYQKRSINNSFLIMDDLLLTIDLNELHAELRTQKILDSFELVDKNDIQRMKKKI